MAIVFAAGLYDDLQPSRSHGLRAHFAALGRGRVTSGIVKLVAAVVAATIAVVATGAVGGAWRLAIPLIAGVTNLCNLLDVAPGRALKFGFCFAVVLTVVRSSTLRVGDRWAMTAALLPFDVRERAMLGDAGANSWGSCSVTCCCARLSTVGMVDRARRRAAPARARRDRDAHAGHPRDAAAAVGRTTCGASRPQDPSIGLKKSRLRDAQSTTRRRALC